MTRRSRLDFRRCCMRFAIVFSLVYVWHSQDRTCEQHNTWDKLISFRIHQFYWHFFQVSNTSNMYLADILTYHCSNYTVHLKWHRFFSNSKYQYHMLLFHCDILLLLNSPSRMEYSSEKNWIVFAGSNENFVLSYTHLYHRQVFIIASILSVNNNSVHHQLNSSLTVVKVTCLSSFDENGIYLETM